MSINNVEQFFNPLFMAWATQLLFMIRILKWFMGFTLQAHLQYRVNVFQSFYMLKGKYTIFVALLLLRC